MRLHRRTVLPLGLILGLTAVAGAAQAQGSATGGGGEATPSRIVEREPATLDPTQRYLVRSGLIEPPVSETEPARYQARDEYDKLRYPLQVRVSG